MPRQYRTTTAQSGMVSKMREKAGEGMNLQQCWFRFQRATTKPWKWHARVPSYSPVTQHSLCLIESCSDLIMIKNIVGINTCKNRPTLMLLEQALLAIPGRGYYLPGMAVPNYLWRQRHEGRKTGRREGREVACMCTEMGCFSTLSIRYNLS